MFTVGADGSAHPEFDAGSAFSYTATGGWLPNSSSSSNSDCTSEALAKWPATTVSGTVSADESRNNFTLRLNPIVRELTSPSVSAEEQKMAALISQWRAGMGARTLNVFDRASAAADAQATALSATPGLNRHMGPACANFPAFYGELGGKLDSSSDFLGDAVTIAPTSTRTYSADEAFKAFIDSKSGHTQVLSNPRAQAIGVALVDNAWVIELIGKNGLTSTDYTTERLNYTPDLGSLKRTSPCKWCSGNTDANQDTGNNEEDTRPATQQLTVQKLTKKFKAGAKVTLKGRAQSGQAVDIRIAGKTTWTTAKTGNTWTKTVKLPKRIKGKTLKVTVTDGDTTLKTSLLIKRR